MTEKKGKKRFSLITEISLIFVLALVVGVTVTGIATRDYLIESVAEEIDDVAKAASTAAIVAIDGEGGLDRLIEDAEIREQTHQTFRFICEKVGLEYLYLYTVDEENNRHYIVRAAADDEKDVRMNEAFGPDGVQEVETLYEAETRALAGLEEGNYEYIDNQYGQVFMYIAPVISEGKVIALIGADYDINQILSNRQSLLRVMLVNGVLVLGVMLAVMMVLLRRMVLKPLGVLARSMRSYTTEKVVALPQRPHLFENEITDIEGTFEQMTEDITKYVNDVEALTLKETETRTYIAVARLIQEGIVPREHTLVGDRYEISGISHPAKDVGGDFYDLFHLGDDRICIVIGDISGKGVSGALFMVMVKTMIRALLRAGVEPEEVLRRANREICFSNPAGMFATVFAAILHTGTGVLTYANAGHNPPLLFGSRVSFLEEETGMLLGAFEDSEIAKGSVTLAVNDGLFLYTDGVTEAINQEREQFDEERLIRVLREKYDPGDVSFGAGTLVDAVHDAVTDHAQGVEQFDDITCVAVVRREKAESGQSLTPELKSFATVKRMILHSLGESERTKNILLACEEVFVNIVSYSGADSVFFSFRRSMELFQVTFSDNGTPFDPINTKQRKKEFEEFDTGGMGIILAKAYSREMLYERNEDRNELTLIFDIADGDPDDRDQQVP